MVTTALAGNCGVGFAPVNAERRQELVEMKEGVEDIPEAVLAEGLDWNWQSFVDYLDRVSARHNTMDVGGSLTREERLGEHKLLEDIATVSGRPVTYGVAQFASDPAEAPMMARLSSAARRRGLEIWPQCISRGIGSINVLDGFHAFAMKPSYKQIAHRPAAARARGAVFIRNSSPIWT